MKQPPMPANPPGKPLIEVVDLWKSYERGRIQVLRGVTLTVHTGDLVALCGPSGGGKSTLLHLMAGLDLPDRGHIRIDGQVLRGESRLLHCLRHMIGFVFQLHNLIPDLTLEENCMVPTMAAGMSRRQARERLHELAEQTGLSHRLTHRIQDLSGGERQRTALCRALMNSPKIVLADEPTGALDEKNREQVFEHLLRLVRHEGVTLVMATHDRDLAEHCDRLMVVKDGQLYQPAGSSVS